MADRFISDIGESVDNVSEGSMIEVQCQLVICSGLFMVLLDS